MIAALLTSDLKMWEENRKQRRSIEEPQRGAIGSQNFKPKPTLLLDCHMLLLLQFLGTKITNGKETSYRLVHSQEERLLCKSVQVYNLLVYSTPPVGLVVFVFKALF